MRRILLPSLLLVLVLADGSVSAIDVNPSKQTVPREAYDGGGNRFSIFNGDPKRIQRANAVDPKAFDTKVEISPNPMSLKAAKVVGPNPSIKITFSVHNHGKKTYTLSFPTTQRWDYRILNSSGAAVYSYADDHEFLPTVGTSMVNYDDSLTYVETIELSDLNATLAPGTYKIQALMANYPEMHAQADFVVQP